MIKILQKNEFNIFQATKKFKIKLKNKYKVILKINVIIKK